MNLLEMAEELATYTSIVESVTPFTVEVDNKNQMLKLKRGSTSWFECNDPNVFLALLQGISLGYALTMPEMNYN